MITVTTLEAQSDSNISSFAISTSRQNVVVAQQKLNEYSTSCNNVSTSRNNVQHELINKSWTMLNRVSLALEIKRRQNFSHGAAQQT